MQIKATPLTAAAFAAFGEIVAPNTVGKSANAGMASRFDHVVALQNGRTAAKPNLAVFEVQPYALPFAIRELEQHPYSTQTFLPIAATRYAIVVCTATPGGLPDVSSLQAFIVEADRGVSYRAGTWHHAIMALDTPARFVSLTWEDGSAGDCIVHRLEAPMTLAAA